MKGLLNPPRNGQLYAPLVKALCSSVVNLNLRLFQDRVNIAWEPHIWGVVHYSWGVVHYTEVAFTQTIWTTIFGKGREITVYYTGRQKWWWEDGYTSVTEISRLIYKKGFPQGHSLLFNEEYRRESAYKPYWRSEKEPFKGTRENSFWYSVKEGNTCQSYTGRLQISSVFMQ